MPSESAKRGDEAVYASELEINRRNLGTAILQEEQQRIWFDLEEFTELHRR